MTKNASYQTLENVIGKTPLVQLVRLPGEENQRRKNTILAKLEGNNPSGSIKDRAIQSMLHYAEKRGDIHPGDTLIEATSGNTGIALAMLAAKKGYRCMLVMPENTSLEKQQCMTTYGAQIVLTPRQPGMAFARNLVYKLVSEGRGVTLDQFSNPDNPRAHYETTGPEIWEATSGRVTHVLCGMGTTGTIMGISRYLKEKNECVQIIGVEPEGAARIPGLQKWQQAAVPRIYDASRIDRIEVISLAYAEHMARRLAGEEGIFCGLSAAAACEVAMRLSGETENATIVFLVCDRGERYLSMGTFPA